MRLAKEDKDLLKSWGYDDEEIKLVQKVARYTTYLLYKAGKKACGIKIPASKAVRILGWDTFLSGITECVALSHSCTARRFNSRGDQITFDSSAYFRDDDGNDWNNDDYDFWGD